ncbi:uncharacterized protein ARMOST_02591 [Armillaria ostoyae]|uniref:Uncharacterized protein n=1 Tax=Armillaria ostoyae TaxID=47428 RepID=A0A284QS40_ARMOS|nr:uncharacterized protein ARMOST_02591 [Armillaria ostoyae]
MLTGRRKGAKGHGERTYKRRRFSHLRTPSRSAECRQIHARSNGFFSLPVGALSRPATAGPLPVPVILSQVLV